MAGHQRQDQQPLLRRARPREPPRGRADGPDLREPRRSGRQSRPRGQRQGRARDLQAHGHERRGDRGPHRRRTHLRQDAWRRRPRPGGPRARGRGHRAAGPGLDERPRHRQGRRHHHQRPGGRLEAQPHQVGHGLLQHALRLRMGADQEPRRCPPVARQGREARGHDRGRARSQQEASSRDDHRGHVHALRPDLREDQPAFPREPRGVRRRLRPRLVQAHAPGHGSQEPVPGT